jgi:hypothetical protein
MKRRHVGERTVIGHDEAARLARVILDLRQRRTDHLPADLFGEYAWGMLLALFIADAEGKRITALDLFDQSATPRSQGRRWMAVLIDMGFATSEGRCTGNNIVSLTPRGISAVEACMEDAQQWIGTKPAGRVRP